MYVHDVVDQSLLINVVMIHTSITCCIRMYTLRCIHVHYVSHDAYVMHVVCMMCCIDTCSLIRCSMIHVRCIHNIHAIMYTYVRYDTYAMLVSKY
jgi:hypothetical protein